MSNNTGRSLPGTILKASLIILSMYATRAFVSKRILVGSSCDRIAANLIRGSTLVGNTSGYRAVRLLSTQMASGKDLLASFSKPQEGKNVELAIESLAQADAVCFDVDSTVIAEEGIDVLAEYLGKGEAVAELTRNAMNGSQKFQDALQARLDLMKPSKPDIEKCLDEIPLPFSPGIEELVEAMIEKGVDVYLVSGGFRIMIEPVAAQLCIAKDRIYANTILFDEKTGDYVGFDATEPTSADMGKPKALDMIKEAGGYKTMVMVGDGATDAQAKPPADAFIGYGGVVVRDLVREKADWFVSDFESMIKVVKEHPGKQLKN